MNDVHNIADADAYISELLKKQNDDTDYCPTVAEVENLFHIIKTYGGKPPFQNYPPLRAIKSLAKIHNQDRLQYVINTAEKIIEEYKSDLILQVQAALSHLIHLTRGL